MIRAVLMSVSLCLCSLPSVAANQLAENFFASVGVINAVLSPDGKFVALIEGVDENQDLLLVDIKSQQRRRLMQAQDYAAKEASIQSIAWIDNSHLAVQYATVHEGVQNLLDTKLKKQLLVIELPEKAGAKVIVKSVRTPGWLVDTLPGENAFLYAKSGYKSKVYRIRSSALKQHDEKLGKLDKIDGGQFVANNVVASIKAYATRWFLSAQGEPIAVLGFADKNTLSLSIVEKPDIAKELKSWDLKHLRKASEENRVELRDRLVPIAITDDPSTFYCLDAAEDDERSVYKVNFATNTIDLIYETKAFKIVRLILASERNELLGVRVLDRGGVRNIYLDNTAFADAKGTLNETQRSSQLDLQLAQSLDDTVGMFYSEADNSPGRYYVKSIHNPGREVTIGSPYPKLPSQLPSRQVESSVQVEGLDIPYLLTLPKTSQAKPLPLIVLPHGGPIDVFDDRYFNLEPQFFALQGFAVLRVNYRGSSGHTKALRDAGKKQFGNLILTDILEATKTTMLRNDIDQNRVCIVGHSYGGYAAATLGILHPEVFKCAVDVAGISDINLLLNTGSSSASLKDWQQTYIGDPLSEYEKLKMKSPAYLVAQLQIPLFVAHGDEDKIVDVEHAYRLKLMLEKFNKKFEWQIFKNEGHDLHDAQNRVQLYGFITDFVKRSLNIM